MRTIALREMEDMGFHQAEFCSAYHPGLPRLSEREFDDLVGLGVIRVIADEPSRTAGRPSPAPGDSPFRPALSH
jgi:hypothetical protein